MLKENKKSYYGFNDAVSYYKKNYKNIVDVKTYKEISIGFLKFLGDKLLDKGEILLPEKLGFIRIYGKKPKMRIKEDNKINGLAIDWKATKEFWAEEGMDANQYVYFMNEHTNGVRYKTVWYNSSFVVKNKNNYKFILCRAMKKSLANTIRNGKEYIIKR